MRRSFYLTGVFAILFLFTIQLTGTLVQSIYILDLMHTSLDEKALGLLFFFVPVGLLAFRKRAPSGLVWALFGVLFLARGVTPYPGTAGRLLASGLGTGSALALLGVLAGAKLKGAVQARAGWAVSGGLALGLSLSVLLRTLNDSIDLSLEPAGSWVGWGLGLLLAGLLTQLDWPAGPAAPGKKRGLSGAMVGIFLVLALAYFAFSAPAVIARWTDGSYPAIVSAVSLLAVGWAWLATCRPGWLERLPRGVLLGWNLAFTLCLVGTLLAQRVSFPLAAGEVTVQAGGMGWLQAVLLGCMLLLFPVIFLDLGQFAGHIWAQAPGPAELAPGLLWGSLTLVVLVFIHIFSNVWGYIAPVSTPFRNLFWLPYGLAALGISLLAVFVRQEPTPPAQPGGFSLGWSVLLGAVFLASAAASLRAAPIPAAAADPSGLVVMTYNIQAGNDGAAEPSYQRQLALIQQISPDVLALQESDTARISLNNNDYTRYFANRLGYYTYYGPGTVSGTFGTAILSRYPLQNPRVIFTYSDSDEVGSAVAQIEVAGRRFTIYDVHPDGSDEAKVAFAQALLADARGKENVIALGDYNSRKDDPAYLLMAGDYANVWTSVYPSEISPDGTDMSGRNRIDHIFVSKGLAAR